MVFALSRTLPQAPSPPKESRPLSVPGTVSFSRLLLSNPYHMARSPDASYRCKGLWFHGDPKVGNPCRFKAWIRNSFRVTLGLLQVHIMTSGLMTLSPTEMDALRRLPLDLWGAMASVDVVAGVSQDEVNAFERVIERAKSRFEANVWIQGLLEDPVRLSRAMKRGQFSLEPEELLTRIDGILDAVARRVSNDELRVLTEFVLWMGEQFARASSEGISDQQLTISVAESQWLSALKRVIERAAPAAGGPSNDESEG